MSVVRTKGITPNPDVFDFYEIIKIVRVDLVLDDWDGNFTVDGTRKLRTLAVHPPLNRKRDNLLIRKGNWARLLRNAD